MQILKVLLVAGILLTMSIGRVSAQTGDPKEKNVTFEQLPAPVQAAVKQQSAGATVKGYAVEIDRGKKLYEAELNVNGHTKDVTFDTQGKIVSIEEETSFETIPVAARTAIEKAARGRKILLVEIVTEDGKTFYEARITNGKKTTEVAVDATGRSVDEK